MVIHIVHISIYSEIVRGGIIFTEQLIKDRAND